MEKDRSDRVGIAKRHLHRSKQSLQAAQRLIEVDLYADSLSRSYYSAYHACYSGLYKLGYEPKTHKGVSNLVFLHLVEPKLVDRQVLKNFSHLLEERGTADYGALPIIDWEDAEEAIRLAEYVYNQMNVFVDS